MTFPDGYITEPGFDPAEDHIGPFFVNESDNQRKYAFRAAAQHCNVTNIVHGGVLMTFADYCLCMEATDHYKEEDCVTVSFNGNFLSSAQIDDVIECIAKVIRRTGSLVFVTGEVSCQDEVIFNFSAVVKRLKRQAPDLA